MMLYCRSLQRPNKLLNIANIKRGIRTRPPTKVVLTSKSKKVNENFHNENDQNVQDEEDNKPKPINSRRSRFQPGGIINSSKDPKVQNIMQQLKFKGSQKIKDELVSKFQNDGIEVDDNFINQMIEQSKKEQQSLTEYIENPNDTLNKLNIEEMNRYIEWLISDGNERIKTQSKDLFKKKIELERKINTFVANKNNNTIDDKGNIQVPDADEIKNAFITAQELANLKSESALDNLPIFLKHLNKSNNLDLQKSIPLEKFAALYELSTQILDLNKRDECIYRCGKMLYSSLLRELGPRSRPDPINEKFFIESCIKFDDLDHALALFDSRKEKDVKDERFWYELGVSIYLSKYSIEAIPNLDSNKSEDSQINENLDKAMELIQIIREKWDHINNLVLIDGVKKCCVKCDYEDAWWFWEEIEINMNNYGIIPEIEIPETKLFDESETEKVYKYYNRIDPISYKELIEINFAFISSLQFDKAVEILTRSTEIDNDYMYEFIKRFSEQFKYPGRELLLIHLENDSKSDERKYIPEISDYLINEISSLQRNRCSSFEEAKILEEINIYFERLSILKSKNIAKVRDLKEIIECGEKLTSFDIKSIISILLDHKSTTSFELALKIITQMNNHKIDSINDSIIPPANSYAYSEFCKQLLSQPNPRIKEINLFLSMMADLDIKLDPSLANKIITSYISKRLYSESIKFVEKYLFSDNPIAINHIKIGKPNSKNLWTSAFMAYYKPLTSGLITQELFKSKLSSLRFLMECLMSEKVDDDFTIQQGIGSLLAYGDYQGVICMLQWYGKQNETCDLSFDFVYAVKQKLEMSILKADKYLMKNNKAKESVYKEKIGKYRKFFGVESLRKYMKTKSNIPWQEVAMDIYHYAGLFGYNATYTRTDPFSMLLSDSERNKNREAFRKDLEELETHWGLLHWKPEQ